MKHEVKESVTKMSCSKWSSTLQATVGSTAVTTDNSITLSSNKIFRFRLTKFKGKVGHAMKRQNPPYSSSISCIEGRVPSDVDTCTLQQSARPCCMHVKHTNYPQKRGNFSRVFISISFYFLFQTVYYQVALSNSNAV